MRGSATGQGTIKHYVNKDQHSHIQILTVCNKADFDLRFKLPTVSSQREPVCLDSRQNRGLSIMNVLVSSERDKNKRDTGNHSEATMNSKPAAICFISYIDRILSLIILMEFRLTEMP